MAWRFSSHHSTSKPDQNSILFFQLGWIPDSAILTAQVDVPAGHPSDQWCTSQVGLSPQQDMSVFSFLTQQILSGQTFTSASKLPKLLLPAPIHCQVPMSSLCPDRKDTMALSPTIVSSRWDHGLCTLLCSAMGKAGGHIHFPRSKCRQCPFF